VRIVLDDLDFGALRWVLRRFIPSVALLVGVVLAVFTTIRARRARLRKIALYGTIGTKLEPTAFVAWLAAHSITARDGEFDDGRRWVMVETELMLLYRWDSYEIAGVTSELSLASAIRLAAALRTEEITFRFERKRGDGVSLGVDAYPDPHTSST